MFSWTRTKGLNEGTPEEHNKASAFNSAHTLFSNHSEADHPNPGRSQSPGSGQQRARLAAAGELSAGGEPRTLRWKSSRDKDRDTLQPKRTTTYPLATRGSPEKRGISRSQHSARTYGTQRSQPLRLLLAWQSLWNPAPATLGSESLPTTASPTRGVGDARGRLPGLGFPETKLPNLLLETSLALPGLSSEAPPFPGPDSGSSWLSLQLELVSTASSVLVVWGLFCFVLFLYFCFCFSFGFFLFFFKNPEVLPPFPTQARSPAPSMHSRLRGLAPTLHSSLRGPPP